MLILWDFKFDKIERKNASTDIEISGRLYNTLTGFVIILF